LKGTAARLRCSGPLAGWLVAGAVLCGWTSTVRAQALRADGARLRDSEGGVVILRGMNVAIDAKVPPFRPLDDLTRLDALPQWGVNVVRLLFTWEAYEPERERYDESYLDYIAGAIEACRARGAWVILDLHQDAFSRFSVGGCGEGFPRWALPPDVTPLEPDNGEACTSWNVQMILDLDMHRAWQAFHANVNGVRDRYLALLRRLGERFGGQPGLIGFDMLNEPWGDEGTELGPLYTEAARALRAGAPQALLFVSPHALTSGGLDTELERPAFDNFVYSPHYYDGGVLLLHAWSGTDLSSVFDQMQAVAQRWNAPLFLGELGAPVEAQGALDYVDALYAQLDRRFASAAHWGFAAHWRPLEKDGWNREDLSVVDDAGRLRANYRVRPFVARIAGEPGSFELTFAEGRRVASALLRWSHAREQGATRLFVAPEAAFGGAVRLEVEGDELGCVLERDGLHVACRSPRAGAKSVRVLPCVRGSADCLTRAADDVESPDAGAPGAGLVDAGMRAVPDVQDAGRLDADTRTMPDASGASGSAPAPDAAVGAREGGSAPAPDAARGSGENTTSESGAVTAGARKQRAGCQLRTASGGSPSWTAGVGLVLLLVRYLRPRKRRW
jgi:endoglycosylceramidase